MKAQLEQLHQAAERQGVVAEVRLIEAPSVVDALLIELEHAHA